MSSTPNQTSPPPKSRWRRRLALLVVGVVALVAAAPWIASTRPAKSLIVGRINAALAPGSVVVQGWSLGWFAPLRVGGIALVDPKGKQVVAAQAVTMEWGIVGLAMARPDLGTITVEGAKVDVERRVDGTVDVLDALATAMKPDPDKPSSSDELAVKVVVKGGTLRAVSPELAEPVVAGRLDGTLTIAPGKPMTLAATLSEGERSLKLDAAVEAPSPVLPDDPKLRAAAVAQANDLTVQVVGKDWPLNLRGDGGLGRGRFGGTLDARRIKGLWTLATVSALDGFEADGPAFRGDHPRFDRVTLVADLLQRAAGGWSVRRLELACPIGRVRAEGMVPPIEGAATKVRGEVDLVGLTRMLPNTLHLQPGLTIDRGNATLTADLTGAPGAERAELAAAVADLAATRNGRAVGIREFPRLAAVAVRNGAKVTVERVEIKADGVDVNGSGDLDGGLVVKGVIDLAKLDAQARDLVDLGKLSFAGHARLAADYRRVEEGYKARLAGDCKDLHVVGLTDQPIHRDLARLDASAIGPRGADGRPTGWQTAKIDLKAGDIQADLAAHREDDDTIRVGGLAAGNLPGPDLGWAEAKIAARWRGLAVDFDELRAWFLPPGAKARDGSDPHTLAVAVRGRVDLGGTGSVALEAIPDTAPSAVGIGPGGLKATGWKGGDVVRVEAGLVGDLAALDGWLAARAKQPANGWDGPWSLTLKAARGADGNAAFDVQAGAADLLGQGAVALATRGNYQKANDRLNLDALDLTTRYAKISSYGNIGAVSTTRQLDWAGTVDPRWDVLGPMIAHSVEPGAKLEAKARPFRLAGPLGGGSLDAILPGLSGEFGLDVASVRAFGVVAGPMPVILKVGGGRAKFDPIATQVNNGPALIQANLGMDADRGVWLRLDESRINGAEINDAVSTSVLAYIAPVLSRATEVTGKVTVVLAPGGAAFPITAKGTTRVEGITQFQDVVFRPGPLAEQVFSITGQAAPKLAFNEPVRFTILDGRVTQSGLAIPLPGASKVEFAGSVGFDKTLQVRATVPITAAMIGRDAQLEKMLDGLKVTVPIGGTMARPVIDRRGLQAATRDAIKTVASQGLKNEAGRLVERVAGGKLPGIGQAVGAATGAGDAAGAAGDPKRDLIKGLLEGLGREALDGGKKP